MKIDLAVWTAVDGYDWQPGSVYSYRELIEYKNEIGPLVPESLPVGGLFLKDGKVVFYRVHIAERMDICGRGAIYCVLGTLPEAKAGEVDFAAIFNSPEMAIPRKPFPVAIDCGEGSTAHNSPLGEEPFEERRFNGVGTFAELAGWCKEAQGGKLKVRITGTFENPLFTVAYAPRIVPKSKPQEPKEELPTAAHSYYNRIECPKQSPCSVQKEKPARDFTKNAFAFGLAVGILLGFILGFLFAKIDLQVPIHFVKNEPPQRLETPPEETELSGGKHSSPSAETLKSSSAGTKESKRQHKL